MAHDVFLSYSSKDKGIAEAACAALEKRGVRCWMAPRDILPGMDWLKAIFDAISTCRVMVLILSADANQSQQVQREVQLAVHKGVIVLPFRTENEPPAGSLEFFLRWRPWLDAHTGPLEPNLDLLGDTVLLLLDRKKPADGSVPEGEYQPPAKERTAVRVRGGSAHPVPVAVPQPRPVQLPPEIAAARRHPRRADIKADSVDCTVYAPPTVLLGRTFLLQAFVHVPEKAAEAKDLAQEFDETAERRGVQSLEMDIRRGTRLAFHLTLPGLAIDDPVQYLTWQGRTAAVQFAVSVAKDFCPGTVVGTVRVSQDGVPLGHVKFLLKVSAAGQTTAAGPKPLGDHANRYRMVFISYASKDRDEVLKRVQMLDRLGIEYFQDVLKLKPGARWEKQLYRHIDACDLFLLFWSRAARRSKWVLAEARYALQRKAGNDLAPPEILPVILEGPPPVEPPEDLKPFHFDDPLRYFMGRVGD